MSYLSKMGGRIYVDPFGKDRSLYLYVDEWDIYTINVGGITCRLPVSPSKMIVYRNGSYCIKNRYRSTTVCYSMDEFMELVSMICGDDE
ncbi:MAG: hypothetical protein QXN51_05135 [Ignisphaera sp.]